MVNRLLPVLCLALFTGLAHMPAAAADPLEDLGLGSESCTVSVSGSNQEDTCSFSCKAGDTLRVSASASLGDVSISGSCGGASASCSTSDGSCPDSASVAAAGIGECVLNGAAGGGEDAGTGSCASSTPPPPPPPQDDCITKVGDICVTTGDECLNDIIRRLINGEDAGDCPPGTRPAPV